MAEFEADVVGIGVLVEARITEDPKLVEGYLSLLQLKELDLDTGEMSVAPMVSF